MITAEERLMRVGIAAETAREIVRQIREGGVVDAPLIANQNLADLPNAAQARLNLGLGSSATQPVSVFATAQQGQAADSAVQPDDLAAVATSGSYDDLANKPAIPAAQVNADWAADNGVAAILNKPTLGTAAAQDTTAFATAAQGGKADTALQPTAIGTTVQGYSAILAGTTASYTAALNTKLNGIAAGATVNQTDAYLLNRANHIGAQAMSTVTGLSGALDGKVDKQAGYGLSQEDYTAAEKAKLAGLDDTQYWKGEYTSFAALVAAHPTAVAGAYADVDPGEGEPVTRYIWDASDAEWVAGGGEAAPITASQVKVLYESNPDTNAFTDAEKDKLGNIAAGATANAGTVTSVQVAVPTGLQASGGPVTTSGTLTISYAAGYSIPANTKQTQWDTAFGWGDHATAGYALASSLKPVATSGSYDDLTDKPTIPAAQVNADWNAGSGVAQILNKPTIPTSPGGDFVGTTATQVLTSKTLGTGSKESVTTGATITINDAAAPFQQITMTANQTATVNLSVGVSRSIWVNPGTYTITWPAGTILVGDIANLPASKWSLITLTGMPSNTAGVAALVASQP